MEQKAWLKGLISSSDGLYEKLANFEEGWSISVDDKNIHVPLNELDECAYRVLQKAIEQNQKVALALPKVKVGVSLSVIAYLVVNRFLKNQSRPFPNLIPLALPKGQNVVVATRNRKLRDFFMASGLRFSYTNFPFTQFPIFRLNRLGEVIPLFNKSEGTHFNLDHVIFYHYDDPTSLPSSLDRSSVIAELTENDSFTTVTRFCSFIEKINASSALVFVNEYASSTLDLLKKNGFKIISFSNDDISLLNLPKLNRNLPSLGSSLTDCPQSIRLKVEVVEDNVVSLKLNQIIKHLIKLNKRIDRNKPLFFLKAWYSFYALKDLAVPLEKLEEARKKNSWLKSIDFTMQQAFKFPLSKLDDNLRNVFSPVWRSLGLEFEEMYKQLRTNNQKELKLKKMFSDSFQSNKSMTIIFPTAVDAEIFKEEVIIEFGWIEYDSNINIGSLDALEEILYIGDQLVLCGVWRKNDLPKILSLLPKEIIIICYISELISLSKSLAEFNSEYIPKLKYITSTSLSDMHFGIAESSINTKLIEPDNNSNLLLDHFRDLLPADDIRQEEAESLDWLDSEPEIIESEDMEQSLEDIDKNEELIAAYLITLTDGRSILIPAQQEVITYSDDSGAVESKLPELLITGDVILLYSDEKNHEMFQTMLQRTSELSKADARVLATWKNALKELRRWYVISNPNSLRAYLYDLRDLHCNKSQVTVKQWLKGLTMAPREAEDIEILLQMIKYKNAPVLSKLIAAEMEKVRVFHRILGRRLHTRFSQALKENYSSEQKDTIDREIDEILENADIVTVNSVGKEVEYVSKDKVKVNIFS